MPQKTYDLHLVYPERLTTPTNGDVDTAKEDIKLRLNEKNLYKKIGSNQSVLYTLVFNLSTPVHTRAPLSLSLSLIQSETLYLHCKNDVSD